VKPQTEVAKPNASVPNEGVVLLRISPLQAVRTAVVVFLTAVVVLGALFLLWQVRTFVAWFIIAIFLAAVLNPAVNWLQRRHRLIKRSLAIVLTYVGLVVALLFIVVIFLPLLVDQIRGLINFAVTVAQASEGPTEYLKGLAQQ